MQPDTSYQLVDRRGNRKALNSQRIFSDMAKSAAKEAEKALASVPETTAFKVHQPSEK